MRGYSQISSGFSYVEGICANLRYSEPKPKLAKVMATLQALGTK